MAQVRLINSVFSVFSSGILSSPDASCFMLLFQAYGTAFLHRVKHKHTMAKNYFFQLPTVTERLPSGLRSGNSSATSSATRSISGQSRRIAQSSAWLLISLQRETRQGGLDPINCHIFKRLMTSSDL